jgi:hypothetical protein
MEATDGGCAMAGIFSPTGSGSNLPGADSDPPEQALSKRTYKPPRLRTYGTLRDITLTVGEHGRADGQFTKKTSV